MKRDEKTSLSDFRPPLEGQSGREDNVLRRLLRAVWCAKGGSELEDAEMTEERGRYIAGGDGSHWDGCEEVHPDCKIAKLERELAEAREADRWIPVSERLPQRDETVWVACYEFGQPPVFAVARCWQSTWYLDADFYHIEGQWQIAETVTHWRPLPEPPQAALDAAGEGNERQ